MAQAARHRSHLSGDTANDSNSGSVVSVLHSIRQSQCGEQVAHDNGCGEMARLGAVLPLVIPVKHVFVPFTLDSCRTGSFILVAVIWDDPNTAALLGRLDLFPQVLPPSDFGDEAL